MGSTKNLRNLESLRWSGRKIMKRQVKRQVLLVLNPPEVAVVVVESDEKLNCCPEKSSWRDQRRRRRRRPPSKSAVFSTFMSQLLAPLKRQPTLKTPHSIEKKKGNMKPAPVWQTILSAGVRL